jgi:transcriptional regulator with XRE-family HTH domain
MNNIEKLNSLAAGKISKWVTDAKGISDNAARLRKSGRIALNIITSLKNQGKTQKDLAEMMEVSPQQISKILSGKENITLDTICKIEEALGVELIEVPLISSKPKESEKYFTYSVTYKTEIVKGSNPEYVPGDCYTEKKLV